MEDQKSDNNPNKIPSRMARLAWPKAKYGVIIAAILIIVVNIIYYKDFFLSLFKYNFSDINFKLLMFEIPKFFRLF